MPLSNKGQLRDTSGPQRGSESLVSETGVILCEHFIAEASHIMLFPCLLSCLKLYDNNNLCLVYSNIINITIKTLLII